MVLRNITVDDRNTTEIKYQGFWFNQGTYNATSITQSGTLSSSNDPNANFTIDTPPILAFYYFGIKRSKGGFYQICIDCDPNDRHFQDVDGLNTTDNGLNPPVVLFSINFTDPQPHEIIITNRPDTRFANNNSQITLDDLVYTIDDGTPPPPSSVSQTSASATTTQASSPGKSNGIIIAAVISSVVGSILILLLIVFFILRGRRKRMSREAAAAAQMSQRYAGDISAAELNSSFSSQGSSRHLLHGHSTSSLNQSRTTAPGHRTNRSLSSLASNDPARNLLYTSNPSASSRLQSSYTSQSHTRSGSQPSRVPRREEDAGSVHGLSEYGDDVTLPPDYQDATRNRRRETMLSDLESVEETPKRRGD